MHAHTAVPQLSKVIRPTEKCPDQLAIALLNAHAPCGSQLLIHHSIFVATTPKLVLDEVKMIITRNDYDVCLTSIWVCIVSILKVIQTSSNSC